jgi:hypothetical protein
LKENIPRTEDEWQKARKRQRFLTSDDINTWVSNLVLLDRALPEPLQRFINAAIFCVESCMDEDKAIQNYKARIGTECSIRSLRNYKVLILSIIALMDEVYIRLRHRAFEAVLLYGR